MAAILDRNPDSRIEVVDPLLVGCIADPPRASLANSVVDPADGECPVGLAVAGWLVDSADIDLVVRADLALHHLTVATVSERTGLPIPGLTTSMPCTLAPDLDQQVADRNEIMAAMPDMHITVQNTPDTPQGQIHETGGEIAARTLAHRHGEWIAVDQKVALKDEVPQDEVQTRVDQIVTMVLKAGVPMPDLPRADLMPDPRVVKEIVVVRKAGQKDVVPVAHRVDQKDGDQTATVAQMADLHADQIKVVRKVAPVIEAVARMPDRHAVKGIAAVRKADLKDEVPVARTVVRKAVDQAATVARTRDRLGVDLIVVAQNAADRMPDPLGSDLKETGKAASGPMRAPVTVIVILKGIADLRPMPAPD